MEQVFGSSLDTCDTNIQPSDVEKGTVIQGALVQVPSSALGWGPLFG